MIHWSVQSDYPLVDSEQEADFVMGPKNRFAFHMMLIPVFAIAATCMSSAVHADQAVEYWQKGEELYDNTNDPGQFTNLAKASEHKKVLTKCRRVLAKKLEIK